MALNKWKYGIPKKEESKQTKKMDKAEVFNQTFAPTLPFVPTVPGQRRLDFSSDRTPMTELPKTTQVKAPITGRTFGLDNVKTFNAPKEEVATTEIGTFRKKVADDIKAKFDIDVTDKGLGGIAKKLLKEAKLDSDQRKEYGRLLLDYIESESLEQPTRAGFIQGVSLGDTMKNVREKAPEESAVIEQKPQYKVGEFGGNLAKYASAYSLLGPAIAGTGGATAGGIGAATGTLAPTVAQQLGYTLGTGAVGALTGELAKDVVLGTAIGGTEAIAQGQKGREVAKTIAQNILMDLGFNLGGAAIGTAFKGFKALDEATKFKTPQMVDEVAKAMDITTSEASKVIDDEIKLAVEEPKAIQSTLPTLKPVAEDIGAIPESARLDIKPTITPKFPVAEPIDTLSKVMIDIPVKAKPKLGENLERIYQEAVSKNAPFEAIARKTDTDILRAYSSNLNRTTGTIDHNIAKYQSDMDGNQVGDSIQSIFKEVNEGTKPQFFDYVLNKHNVERYGQGKPVFGDTVTSDISLAKASQYEANYPQFVEQQKKVTTYFNNLMNEWAIKSGLVSEDTAKMLKEMYPNYVPTYRATEIEKAMGSGDGNFVSQILKKAKGSEKDILPLDQQMAILTDRTIRNARKNEVMTMLDDVYQANPEIASKYIYNVKKVGEKSKVDDLLDVGKELEKPIVKEGDRYKVTYYRNGEPYQMTINKTLYESLATVEKDALDKGLDVVKKYATNPFKSLITQKNPIFFIRNVMRDIPTALIYSNDSLGLVKNTPEAIKEMLTNGKLWNQYQVMGGTRSGLFNYEKGVKIDFQGNKKSLSKKIFAGTGEALEMANNMTETLPRFAEYITSIKKGEPPMLALMRASEITTDFSRFGKQTKRADAVVPYLNASVQGLDKFFRQMRDKPLQTMAKGGLVVSVPALILDQVNKNNKDYNEMTTRERNNYYHIPLGDKFIRIPRSREVGVLFGTALEWMSRAARGQEVTGEEIKETLKSNFTPVNGFDSNIIKPALNFIDIATGKNKDAKNFFGSNIVSQSLQRYSPGQQFTENTTSISKALGEFLDIPPVAIDYLFDSYLGVIADVGMPLLTDNKKKALSPFENAFIADPVFKSASVDKLYSDINKFDELSADANKKYDFDSKLVTPYESYRNSLTKVSKELSELRKQQKEAQAKNNEELVRDLRKRMNDISKKATDSLPTEQELKKEFELFQRKVGK